MLIDIDGRSAMLSCLGSDPSTRVKCLLEGDSGYRKGVQVHYNAGLRHIPIQGGIILQSVFTCESILGCSCEAVV